MKKIFFAVLFLIFTSGLFAQEKKSIVVLSPEEFHESIKGINVQLIDVRTPEEFAEGHIEGAQNIDFHSNDFLTLFSTLDEDKPVYIYCKRGNRSAKAAKELSEVGFVKIIELKGGYLAREEFFKE